MIRDVLEYWDDYAIDGRVSPRKGIPANAKQWNFEVELDNAEIVLTLGTNRIAPLRLCEDVHRLGDKIDAAALDAITPPSSPLRDT